MNRTLLFPALVVFASTSAHAATRQVGPGKTYAKPCAAIAAAADGDIIEIDPGTYSDTCAVNANNLTIRGVNGRANIDAQGLTPAQQKGVLVLNGDNVTLENLGLLNAVISAGAGSNAAGIRMQSQHLTVRNCLFKNNQNGILATPLQAGGELTVESSEFDHNGMGNACNTSGCTHNMYIGHLDKFTLRASYSHDAVEGHLVKSRAANNFILYNRIVDGSDTNAHPSYEVDLPNGGLSYVIGNVIIQEPQTGNPVIVDYGEEGLSSGETHHLYVVNNSILNNRGSGTFVQAASSSTLVMRNNILAGAGSACVYGGSACTASNATQDHDLATTSPGFVDAAHGDLHLTPGSPAVNAGVAPGSGDSFDLTPTRQYVDPLTTEARTAVGAIDVGAYELGGGGSTSASSTSAGTTSGSSTTGTTGSSAGTTSGSTTGTTASTNGGNTSGGTSGSSGGTAGAGGSSGSTGGGMTTGGCASVDGSALAGLFGLALLLRRRR